MLNIFLGRKPLPRYRLSEPANGQMLEIIVKEDVGDSSIVRNIPIAEH